MYEAETVGRACLQLYVLSSACTIGIQADVSRQITKMLCLIPKTLTLYANELHSNAIYANNPLNILTFLFLHKTRYPIRTMQMMLSLWHTPWPRPRHPFPALHLNRVLHQALIPLNTAPNQERPTRPKRRQPRLVRALTADPIPKCARQRETHGTYQIPRADPPAQHLRRRLPPLLLRLEAEEQRGDDEADAPDDLRCPVRAVDARCREGGLYRGQGRESRNPEDRCTEEL